MRRNGDGYGVLIGRRFARPKVLYNVRSLGATVDVLFVFQLSEVEREFLRTSALIEDAERDVITRERTNEDIEGSALLNALCLLSEAVLVNGDQAAVL